MPVTLYTQLLLSVQPYKKITKPTKKENAEHLEGVTRRFEQFSVVEKRLLLVTSTSWLSIDDHWLVTTT